MKISTYNPNTKYISGTLSDKENKIIALEFEKVNPSHHMEIELLDKKGFIEEKKVRDAIALHRKLINSNSENFKPFDINALNGLLTKIQTDMGMKK